MRDRRQMDDRIDVVEGVATIAGSPASPITKRSHSCPSGSSSESPVTAIPRSRRYGTRVRAMPPAAPVTSTRLTSVALIPSPLR